MKRRELLTWIAPVVTTVVLPVHAMTTWTESCDEENCSGVGVPLQQEVPLTSAEVERRRKLFFKGLELEYKELLG